MKKNWTNYLYLLTVLFFVLGFFNIIFAWFGFICLATPFVLLAKNKKKTWCQNYCPRASLFSKLFSKRSLTGKPAPNWLIKRNAKWFVLAYFVFNLFILTMSTIMVSLGRVEAIEKVRFLIAFTLPWDMPQIFNVSTLPEWSVHLSYRMYSMMFTTTVLGILLAWIFKPRTWCTICPVNTVSSVVLNKINK